MAKIFLILTLAGGWEGGKAIHSIEFQSKAACEVAAQMWLGSLKMHNGYTSYHVSSAVCVEDKL